MNEKVTTIQEAQQVVKNFAVRNGWPDLPNVDKFDHLHEELIEMSQYLRYKSEAERVAIIQTEKAAFVDGVGDLFFGICRLANQLDIDIAEAFNQVKDSIMAKYDHQNAEDNRVKGKGSNL
jgi:NTP pyrophosphatase (non-canonical NTP hydrolase)